MDNRYIQRGEIYKILFPYTFDKRYPNGKLKYVLVLQSGEYFESFTTTVGLLLTSNDEADGLEHTVKVEKGTTDLPLTSYIDCSQPYTIQKSRFFHPKVTFYGRLTNEIMDQVDDALFIGMCTDKQNE